jgi:hypothetical protein
MRFDPLPSVLKRVIQLFFKPVELDFELADLLVQSRSQRLVILGNTPSPGWEDVRQHLQSLLFPLQDLIRMHALSGGHLIDRLLTFDGC